MGERKSLKNKRNINKKRSMILIIIVIIFVITTLIYALSHKPKTINNGNNTDNGNVNNYEEPVIQKEIKLNEVKAQIIYNNIQKIYEEAEAPFTDEFKLKVAMDSILIENQEINNFSETNINAIVEEIFGPGQTLDKTKLTDTEDGNKLYFYSKDLGEYTVKAYGKEFVYSEQVLKKVTEDKDSYYVYVYYIVGEFIEDDINNKTSLIIGDKDGKDIIENLKLEDIDVDVNALVVKYKNILPVYKYTLTKKNGTFYLKEIEQINY